MRRQHTIQLDDRGMPHVHRCPECRQIHLCVADCAFNVNGAIDPITKHPFGFVDRFCDGCKWTQCPECSRATEAITPPPDAPFVRHRQCKSCDLTFRAY